MVKQPLLPQNKCNFAIDRLNRLQSINFAKLTQFHLNGTMRLYSDPDFTSDPTSIIWNDYASPKLLAEVGKYQKVGWKRVQSIVKDKKCLNRFFGLKGISSRDVVQGMLGDCWLLSGIATLAAREDRLTKIFLNKDLAYPRNGLVGVSIRVLNKPMVITVDDNVPVANSKTLGETPIFARGSKENDYWVCLVEKAFAKMYGNYA
jgi:hypothetical protein